MEAGTQEIDDPMKFRKRPIVIDAEQWTPGVPTDGVVLYEDFPPCPKNILGCPCDRCVLNSSEALCKGEILSHGWVKTMEGWYKVYPGNWIVTGIAGEKYPVDDEIFAETYEPVELAGATG